ncbi:PREDICTED: uncharacterized protein LOC108790917 [Nanorana parkeri]|uniref:uncharacterized protein LOC108790917 n=1 Tax=Nanorana parkeri TaxID=125878 RepID=UPI0008546737|nr:PREDICTED: uncharacterized protein LOC108790917 [Nanorana parkeri]
MVSSRSSVIWLLWSLLIVKSQNLIKNLKEVTLEGQLLISEVNPDNPGHDTAEFIELHHTSGQNVSLDGYTLVLYNGRTNAAYKVFNLTGYSTDKKGFFLIGSLAVKPAPTIILQNNTIQNGPDAIALYFGKGTYKESMQVTRDGLVDALVHKSKSTDQADGLLSTLTPGMEAFFEDANFHSADESIGRCLDIDGKWTFHLTHVSPGSENHCKGFPIMINEVSSPYAEQLYVEIHGPPSTSLSGLTIAFINGMDQQVYFSTDIRGQTDPSGLFLLVNEKHDNRAQQTLPNNARLLLKGGGAVVLYLGKSSEVLQKNRYTTSGLVNALVYGDYEDMGSHPLQDLTTGNNIIYWHTWDVNISASLCSQGEGMPTIFMLGGSTPGQANECPPVPTHQNVTLCFKINTDCSLWEGGEELSDLLTAVAQSLQTLCKCHVFASMFTDASLTCQLGLLTLHAKQNATMTPQSVDLVDIHQFVTTGNALNVRNKSAIVTSVCTPPTTISTTPPEITTFASPPINPGLLLINEVNPNTPGSAEDTEYVELYHTSNSSVNLVGYWLVLYNGKNNLAYSILNLKGYSTDNNGYFLIGSNKMTPKPHIQLRPNTIQNGADAIALYYRPRKTAFTVNMPVTPDGLVDAMVYVSQARDDASGLLKVLTPGQEAVHEDDTFIVEDESLSRCLGLKPFDHSAYQVTKITPLTKNDCEASPIFPFGTSRPRTSSSPPASSASPMTLLISEVGVMRGAQPYSFIELKGPPGGQIQGYTLVMYNREGKVYEKIGVQGGIRDTGLYVISTNGTGDQQLPVFTRPYTLSPEALALYKGSPELFSIGSTLTQKDLVDASVYTWESGAPSDVLGSLNTPATILYGEHRLVSLSLCSLTEEFSTALLPVQQPSPGSENICPSTVTSIQLDLCMKDSNLDCSEWMKMEPITLNRMKILLSHSIENHCSCTIPPSYIQKLNVTCMQDKLSLSGDILSTHSDQLLIQRWNNDLVNHSPAFTFQDKSLGSFTGCLVVEKKQESFKVWQVSLLVLLLLLIIFGAVGFIIYLRKRTPQNYTSIEMNAHRDLAMEY